MTRQVRDANGRLWTVHGTLEWRRPSTDDDFEHDVNAGYVPGVVMLSVVILLTAVLVVWRPGGVVVPVWLVLLILAVILFFPARWALRRPWKLVAETGDDGEGEPTEKWVGMVRGYFTAKSAIGRIAKDLQADASPSWEGPLKPQQ